MDDDGCLSVEDALDIRSFLPGGRIGISAGGTHLAYTLKSPNEEAPVNDDPSIEFDRTGCPDMVAGSTVWITDVARGESVRLGEGGSTSWSPEWSPDGTRVAYYCNETGLAQLWVWDLATRQSRRVSDVVVRPFFPRDVPRWTLDGTGLIVKSVPAGLTVEQANGLRSTRVKDASQTGKCTAVVYGEGDESQTAERYGLQQASKRHGPYYSDLVLVDVETGRVAIVAPGVRPAYFLLSPDGSRILYAEGAEGPGNADLSQPYWDLVVVAVADGSRRVLASCVPFFLPTTV